MNVNISARNLPLTYLSITFNSSKFLLKDGVEQPGLELPDLGAGRGDVHGILHDSCDSLHDSLVTAYLERGEEGAVDEGGLEVAQPGRHVTGHPEVGVLVSRVNILIHN